MNPSTPLDGDRRLLRLTDDVFVFGSYPYAGLVVTDDGCLAIDGPMSPRNIAPWRDFIRARGPLAYQVYCEHHQDHIASACFLEPAVLISSEDTFAELPTTEEMLEAFGTWADDPAMQADALDSFEMRYPTLTFSDRLSLTLGGKRFVLFRASGHTIGSTVVHAVDDRVAFIADTGFTPAIQSGDPWLWLRAIATLESLDVDWYVQGHGEPFDRDALGRWRTALLSAIDRIRDWAGAGVGIDEAVERGGVFAEYMRTDHVGVGDMPPRLREFSSTVLQQQGMEIMYAALGRHPSSIQPAPAAPLGR